MNENDEPIDPLSDLKMWSHYGKNHQGCCIVFDKDGTISAFNQNVQDSVSKHGRVEYNELHNYVHSLISPFQPKGFIDYEFKRLFSNLFFNKGKHYSGENEYRFAINNNNNGDLSLEVIPIIKRIVLAENAKEDDILSIVRLCELFDIEVGKMTISKDKLTYTKSLIL